MTPPAPDPVDRLVLTTPRISLFFALVAFALFMALGLWVISMSDDFLFRGWSWIGVILLAAGVVMALVGLRRPPSLILTPEGFTLTGPIGVGPIAWNEVERFFIYESSETDEADHSLPHAVWSLKPGSPHRESVISALNRAGEMGMDGSLPRNIGMAPEPLVEVMESWRLRYS